MCKVIKPINKQNVASVYNEIPFGNLREQATDTCYDMGELQKITYQIKKTLHEKC